MLKKIILLTTILLLSSIPALADDGTRWDDGTIANIKIISAPKSIKMGSEYTCTVEITNYTNMYMHVFSIHTGISFVRNYDMSENEVYFEPYQKKRIEITSVVSDEIPWFKKDGVCFVNLKPEIHIETYKSSSDLENYRYNGSYIIGSKKAQHIEIANLKDGSEYIYLDFPKDTKPFIYQCVERIEKDNTYEYNGNLYTPMLIKNISPAEIKDIYIPAQGYYTDERFSLNAGETTIMKMKYSSTAPCNQKPDAVNIQHQLIFKLNNEYYGVATEKIFPTQYFDMPKMTMQIKLDKQSQQSLITLHNYSSKDIANFCISLNGYDDDGFPLCYFPIIAADETVVFSTTQHINENFYIHYDMGYVYDDYLVMWEFGNNHHGELIRETDDYLLWQINLYKNLLYYAYSKNEKYVKSLINEATPTPSIMPVAITTSPNVSTNTPSPTVFANTTTLATQTISTDDIVTTSDRPYIPLWVWIVLTCTIVVTIEITLFIYIKGKKYK